MDPLDAFLKIMQALSAPLTLLVAVAVLRGRSDDKNTMLVEMRKDIEHIKENTACIPNQSDRLVKVEASAAAAHKRLDDHMRYDHGQKTKEDIP